MDIHSHINLQINNKWALINLSVGISEKGLLKIPNC